MIMLQMENASAAYTFLNYVGGCPYVVKLILIF